jgi:hypothetical protein
MRRILQVVSKGLFGVAGLLFLFGGRAIQEFRHIDRMVAEMEGLGLCATVACLGIGVGAAADYITTHNRESESS